MVGPVEFESTTTTSSAYLAKLLVYVLSKAEDLALSFDFSGWAKVPSELPFQRNGRFSFRIRINLNYFRLIPTHP